MLIIALVLALVGLVALVFAVVTSNELVAWVCIVASVVGVVLLIIDALQERRRRDAGGTDATGGDDEPASDHEPASEDYPEEAASEEPSDEPATEASADATEESAVSAEGRSEDHT
jgi:hypothetical protein